MDTTQPKPDQIADRWSEQPVDGVSGEACFHCGQPCETECVSSNGKNFCCNGCLSVHKLLFEAGLDRFYELNPAAGTQATQKPASEWAFLDDPEVRDRVLDFAGPDTSRITLHIPAIHCIACVWLLENLFRLHPGIGQSIVNFPRREVAIVFAPGKISLSQLAALLASVGYAPQITLEKLDKRRADPVSRRQWLQTGIAGFAFGNIMLATLPLYIGLDSFSGPLVGRLLGWVSLLLALPVVTYSASDYWRSALLSIHHRMLTLDVPIAIGLAAIYLQSAYEILAGTGGGYLDSLCGLVFFLLCGRIFQGKTHDRIAFDRDYKSFFPLSTTRRTGQSDQSVPISAVKVGDRLLIRNGELIPADGLLRSGAGVIDYSFVTGESAPATLGAGDRVYAGGKQCGGAIEIETAKPVSQSYLTSLWDHKVFRKDGGKPLASLTNAYGRRFTKLVIAIALFACLGWTLAGDFSRGAKAFTSVLIVACPCALALAAPFTLGTAQRALSKLNVFVRNPIVLERLAEVNTIVFDKTGTLTAQGRDTALFEPWQTPLSSEEADAVRSIAAQSTHPHALAISAALNRGDRVRPLTGFSEVAGRGIRGRVGNRVIEIGSAKWLRAHGVLVPEALLSAAGSVSHLSMDGKYAGRFLFAQSLRERTAGLLKELQVLYDLELLSGDNERERDRFRQLLGPAASLKFNQTPVEKLERMEALRQEGRIVMMVGDGLNDAGAFRSADVGLALVDHIGVFSPASDVIMEARDLARLHDVLRLSKECVKIVRLSFALSAAYNAIGISVAAAGALSPIICAVLMPLSSFSVALMATALTNHAARRLGVRSPI